MRALLVMPLLLAACTASWPAGSYVQPGSDADMAVLAPAVSDCLSNIVPPHAAIAMPPSDAALASIMADVLTRNGFTLQGGGQAVATVIAPLDAGEFIRVSAAQGACSQYFSRASGALKPDGPIMVMTR